MDFERDISRRSLLKGSIAAALSYVFSGQGHTATAPSTAEQGTDNEAKKTEFYQVMKEIADKLGWRVRTTATTGEHATGRCLSINQTKDWEGCISTFDGFEIPPRQIDFEPAGYLVYAWGEYKSNNDSGQRLFVFPQEIKELPLNSGGYANGTLFDTFEQQKEAASKFGFIFPVSLEAPFPRGITGPIGYWGLSGEEKGLLGNIYINLP